MNAERIGQLKRAVADRLDMSRAISDEELLDLIEQEVLSQTWASELIAEELAHWVNRLFHSFRGLDVLQQYVDDASITEIMVNGHQDIFVEREGQVIRTEEAFESRERLEDIIQSVVSKVNRTVNESSPLVDARLPDGSRVNVVLPPIALNGPTMTIRKFPEKPLTMDDLIAKGAISSAAANVLQTMVAAKYNLFIGGGTGSGKTTFLNALSQWIPSGERIVTIEDSAELQIRTVPNLVSLETRNANTEGKGEITIRDLIRTSLRMRPDRIIVGEVRGAEALDMLQAMNTGHDGSLSTGHANTSRDMLSRLETMVLSATPLPVEVIRKQICSAIDVLIHLSRMRDSTRKLTEISELIGVSNGEIELRPLFRFEERGAGDNGAVVGELVFTGERLRHVEKLKAAGLTLPEWIMEGGE